jgi:hypothetical protein
MILKMLCRGAGVLVLATGIVAVPGAGMAAPSQDTANQPREFTKEQQQQIIEVRQLTDEAMASEAPADAQAFAIGWGNHFLKADSDYLYVPFTITVPADALSTPAITFYLRVVSHAALAEEPAEKPAPFAFENVWFPELKTPAPGQPYTISRAFLVPAGDYDAYVVVRERLADSEAAPKVSVLKQPVTVPDYWNGELTTSSVIVADTIEQLTAPQTPEEQEEHPYVIGAMQLTPAADDTFTTDENLSALCLIYNPAVKDKKPDIQVDYKFYQKTADGEELLADVEPTLLNADTLPAEFDLDLGYPLVAGQVVGLSSFPPGDYRLEIAVEDKLGQKSLTRDVLFTVSGS